MKGLLLIVIVFAATRAHAQAFFGGGAVAFDPEVAVLQSGALLDAQATVSNDRKYVTLNLRPSANRVIALQQFPVNAIVNQGFVGGVNLPAGNAVNFSAQPAAVRSGRGAGRGTDQQTTNAVANPSPDMISRAAKSWVFTRQGMYLISPLP